MRAGRAEEQGAELLGDREQVIERGLLREEPLRQRRGDEDSVRLRQRRQDEYKWCSRERGVEGQLAQIGDLLARGPRAHQRVDDGELNDEHFRRGKEVRQPGIAPAATSDV